MLLKRPATSVFKLRQYHLEKSENSPNCYRSHRERDRGVGCYTFRSHFSKLLSALGRIFQIFCPLKVPFSSFCPSPVTIFSYVPSRAIKMILCVRSRSSKWNVLSTLGSNLNCNSALCEIFSVGPSVNLIKE